MKWRALATDYDGTIAHDGAVDEWTVAALRRSARAGLRVILVTGRELAGLFNTFAHTELFDSSVAENGAVLSESSSGGVQTLSAPPPEVLLERLQRSRSADLGGSLDCRDSDGAMRNRCGEPFTSWRSTGTSS